MKPVEAPTDGFVSYPGREVTFSGNDLIELMRAIFDKGDNFRFKVTGFSMFPFVRNEDIVTIAPKKKLSASLGRVAAFIHPLNKKLVVHRLIGKSKDRYIIKGDNTLDIDGVVPYELILGYVVKVERNGKKIIFGLGIERFFIAFCNRINLFPFLSGVVRKMRGV